MDLEVIRPYESDDSEVSEYELDRSPRYCVQAHSKKFSKPIVLWAGASRKAAEGVLYRIQGFIADDEINTSVEYKILAYKDAVKTKRLELAARTHWFSAFRSQQFYLLENRTTAANRAKRLEAMRVLNAQRLGYSMREIAGQLNCSAQQVKRLVDLGQQVDAKLKAGNYYMDSSGLVWESKQDWEYYTNGGDQEGLNKILRMMLKRLEAGQDPLKGDLEISDDQETDPTTEKEANE